MHEKLIIILNFIKKHHMFKKLRGRIPLRLKIVVGEYQSVTLALQYLRNENKLT